MVTADGTTKLTDFGLAIDTTVSKPRSRVGTLEFMAPELVRIGRSDEPHDSSPSSPAAPYGELPTSFPLPSRLVRSAPAVPSASGPPRLSSRVLAVA